MMTSSSTKEKRVTGTCASDDLITHQKTGLQARFKDIDDLTLVIKQLLTEPKLCAQLGETLKKKALEQHNQKAIATIMQDKLEQLISKKGPTHE